MLTNLIQIQRFEVFFFALRCVRKLTTREQAGNPASFGIRYSFPYAAGQCSAEPWVMNINRGITNITITTKRRDVLYKRTQSDETNENCIPATYGIPISRCCGSVPIKIPASKTAPKVTSPTLCAQELMSSAGGMTHLLQSQGLVWMFVPSRLLPAGTWPLLFWGCFFKGPLQLTVMLYCWH